MTRIRTIFFLVIFLTSVFVRPVLAQSGSSPVIKKPQAGDVIQGTLTITGSSKMTGFLASEVTFAYSGDTTGTWFLIASGSQPVEDGFLAAWDTTTITDGVYNLRLRVFLEDGTFREVVVQRLRVRNYTPVETPTPTPTLTPPAVTIVPTITLTPTVIPTSTPFPSPTLLPTNPAILTSVDVSISIGYGGVAGLILLSVLGIYLWLRRK